jgi:hypothetical protein
MRRCGDALRAIGASTNHRRILLLKIGKSMKILVSENHALFGRAGSLP